LTAPSELAERQRMLLEDGAHRFPGRPPRQIQHGEVLIVERARRAGLLVVAAREVVEQVERRFDVSTKVRRARSLSS
jgi:hypothetical protein